MTERICCRMIPAWQCPFVYRRVEGEKSAAECVKNDNEKERELWNLKRTQTERVWWR